MSAVGAGLRHGGGAGGAPAGGPPLTADLATARALRGGSNQSQNATATAPRGGGTLWGSLGAWKLLEGPRLWNRPAVRFDRGVRGRK